MCFGRAHWLLDYTVWYIAAHLFCTVLPPQNSLTSAAPWWHLRRWFVFAAFCQSLPDSFIWTPKDKGCSASCIFIS